MPSAEHTALFKSLLKLLKEQTEALEHRLTDEQLSNLTYAFRKILPKTSDDLAFVIAVGLQQKSIVEVVNEYLRMRRKKNNVFIPYHKIRHAQKALEKTWGLLIYREQVETLLEEITGRAFGNLPATILLDSDVLMECLKPDYKKRLSKREIERIARDLRRFTKIFMNYSWCRAIGERVLKAVESDTKPFKDMEEE